MFLYLKVWDAFFRNVSYEIGDDVFSLAEIEECVVKGKLSKPKQLLAGDTPIPDTDAHYAYAADKADYRVHLALNSGSVSCPSRVFVLTPETYEKQLAAACTLALDHSITVVRPKRIVMLPKVIEVYGPDFGSSSSMILHNCVPFLKGTQFEVIVQALVSSGVLKFTKFVRESHEELSLA